MGYRTEVYSAQVTQSPALRAYITDMQRVGCIPVSAAAERALILRMAAGDSVARDMLIECNMRYVVKIAQGYLSAKVELLDLIMAGNEGLIVAVNRYDVTTRHRITTVADPWIRQRIKRLFEIESRIIRLPGYVHSASMRVWRDDGSATDADRRHAEHIHDDPLSLDRVSENSRGDDMTLADTVPAAMLSTEERMLQDIDNDALYAALMSLSERERVVITQRNGWNKRQTVTTYDTIARSYGCSRERIRQVEAAAIRKLRHYLTTNTTDNWRLG